MELIEKLKVQYLEYENSSIFIDTCFSSFKKAKIKEYNIASFIHHHFSNDVLVYRNCNIKILFLNYNIQLRNSKRQLARYDYINFTKSIKNSYKYRIILKEYELC